MCVIWSVRRALAEVCTVPVRASSWMCEMLISSLSQVVKPHTHSVYQSSFSQLLQVGLGHSCQRETLGINFTTFLQTRCPSGRNWQCQNATGNISYASCGSFVSLFYPETTGICHLHRMDYCNSPLVGVTVTDVCLVQYRVWQLAWSPALTVKPSRWFLWLASSLPVSDLQDDGVWCLHDEASRYLADPCSSCLHQVVTSVTFSSVFTHFAIQQRKLHRATCSRFDTIPEHWGAL